MSRRTRRFDRLRRNSRRTRGRRSRGSSRHVISEGVERIKEKKVRRVIRKLVREEKRNLNEKALSASDEDALQTMGFRKITDRELSMYQNNLPYSMTATGPNDQKWIVGATHDEPEEIVAFCEFGDGAGAVWDWDDVSSDFRSLFLDANEKIAIVLDAGQSAYQADRGQLARIESKMEDLGAEYTYS